MMKRVMLSMLIALMTTLGMAQGTPTTLTGSGPVTLVTDKSGGWTFGYVAPVPVSITIQPVTASVLSAQTLQFTSTVLNTTNTAVNWSAAGGGVISSSGLFTAEALKAGG